MGFPSSSSPASSSSTSFLSPTRFTKEEEPRGVNTKNDIPCFSGAGLSPSPKKQRTIRTYSRSYRALNRLNQINSSPTRPNKPEFKKGKNDHADFDDDDDNDNDTQVVASSETSITNNSQGQLPLRPIRKRVEFKLPAAKNQELNDYFVEPSPVTLQVLPDTRKPATADVDDDKENDGNDDNSDNDRLSTDIFAIFNQLDDSSPIKNSKLPVLKTSSFLKGKPKSVTSLTHCDPLDFRETFQHHAFESEIDQYEDQEQKQEQEDEKSGDIHEASKEESSSLLLRHNGEYTSSMRTYSQSRSYISDSATRLSQESSASSSSDDEERDHLITTTLTSDDNIITNYNHKFGFVGVQNRENASTVSSAVNNDEYRIGSSIHELRAKSSLDQCMFYLDPFMNNERLSIRRSTLLDILIKIEIEHDEKLLKFVVNDINDTVLVKILDSCGDDLILSSCFVSLLNLIISCSSDSKPMDKTIRMLHRHSVASLLMRLINCETFEDATASLSRFDRLKFNKWLVFKSDNNTPTLIALALITGLIKSTRLKNPLHIFSRELIDLIHEKFVSSCLGEDSRVWSHYFSISEVIIDEFTRDQVVSLIAAFKPFLKLLETNNDSRNLQTSIIMTLLLIQSEVLQDQLDKPTINGLVQMLYSNLKMGSTSEANQLSLLIMALLISFKTLMKRLRIDLTSLLSLIEDDTSPEDAYIQGYLALLITSSLPTVKLKQMDTTRVVSMLENFVNELMSNLNDFNTSMIETLNLEIQKLN